MKNIFKALSVFDWITPVVGIAETFANDPTLLQTNSHTVFIPYETALNGGWNEQQIRGLLEEKGISSWASQITNGELFFTVSADQAKWTEEILLSNGVPLK